jgi:hypothetical protein
MHAAATSKVENSAQGSSCKLKFVHGYCFQIEQKLKEQLIFEVPYFTEYSAHFSENDAEILLAHYTWKVTCTNLIHKQSIQL